MCILQPLALKAQVVSLRQNTGTLLSMNLLQCGSIGVEETHTAIPISALLSVGLMTSTKMGTRQAELTTVQAFLPQVSVCHLLAVRDGDSSQQCMQYGYQCTHWAVGLVLTAEVLAVLRAEAVVLVPTDGTIFIFR